MEAHSSFKSEIKNVGEFHDLHAQSDALLLAGVYINFWNMS